MLDVYFGNMDGVEVHAETPEEEQEAAFILNSALSGKTTFLGGCLCPSEADSTVSKGFRLMLSEGTDLYVTPALDVDGTPALEICCTTANEEQQEADEPAYTMELGIEPAKEHYTLRDYIAVMYQFICNLPAYRSFRFPNQADSCLLFYCAPSTSTRCLSGSR